MTEKEKVIKELEEVQHYIKVESLPAHTLKAKLVIDNAIALLKAQEPVEPVYEIGITRCGQCNHEIDKYGGDNYCPQCGRAVKWE